MNKTSKKKSVDEILKASSSHLEYQIKFDTLQKIFINATKKEITARSIEAKKNDKNALSELASGTIFDDGEFVNLVFAEINIIKSSFAFADMHGCDFSKSYLEGCDFSFANLRDCNFSDAVMKDCNFRHANLENVNFRGIDTIFCDFTGAISNTKTATDLQH